MCQSGSYQAAKLRLQEGDGRRALPGGWHMLCAAGAGAVTQLITNPIWVAKTRTILVYGAHAGTAGTPGNAGTARAPREHIRLVPLLRHMWRTEGIRGYYKVLTSSSGTIVNLSFNYKSCSFFWNEKIQSFKHTFQLFIHSNSTRAKSAIFLSLVMYYNFLTKCLM